VRRHIGRTRRWVAWIVVAASLVGACSSPTPAATSPTSPPATASPAPTAAASLATTAGPTPSGPSDTPSLTPSPSSDSLPTDDVELADTSWGKLLDQVSSSGRISKKTALELFAVTIGPLPGVVPPAGATTFVPSGTLAVRSLIPYLEQITPEQRAAAEAFLAAGRATSERPVLAAAIRAGRPGAVVGSAIETNWIAAANTASEYIATKLGRVLTASIDIVYNAVAVDMNGQPVGAYAAPFNDNNQHTGDMTHCVIHVNPSLQAVTGNSLKAVATHEVAHCYSMDLLPAETPRVPWLEEGSATWIALEAVAGQTNLFSKHWKKWLTTPKNGLFSRTYDALGFFAHMKDSGVVPWTVLDEMFKKSLQSNFEAYKVAVAASAVLVDEWAPGYLRDATLGPRWDFAGYAITSDKYAAPHTTLAAGDFLEFIAPPLGAEADLLTMTAEVVLVHAPDVWGRIAFADSTDLLLRELDGKALCTLDGGCTCDVDSAGAGTTFIDVIGDLADLGVSGHLGGGSVQLTGFTLADWCGPSLPAACNVIQLSEVSSVFGSASKKPTPAINVLDGVSACSWEGIDVEVPYVNFNHLSLYLYPGAKYLTKDAYKGDPIADVSIGGALEAWEIRGKAGALIKTWGVVMLVAKKSLTSGPTAPKPDEALKACYDGSATCVRVTLDVTIHIGAPPGVEPLIPDPSDAEVRGRLLALAGVVAGRVQASLGN